MTETNKKNYVTNQETDQVSRALLVWLNEYPDKPTLINYEYLSTDSIGMALSTIQSAYKTAQYVDGTYKAEYQFKIIYRLYPGTSNNKRLAADEDLNALADWMISRRPRPQIGADKTVKNISCDARSSLFARYEDGAEDHQILMTMIYEVI